MPKKKTYEYRGLSKRAKALLSGDENYDVDFKEELSGLKPVDFVAFANSPTGGTLLIGIRDTKHPDGRQLGEIVGCTISDEAKLSIVSRAQSCVPAISVEIFVENAADKPFYRIEIGSGKNKPYSTASGKYKIRGDGRNLPMHPTRLLEMFLEEEGMSFYQTFQNVTRGLEESLSRTISELSVSVEESRGTVEAIRAILREESGLDDGSDRGDDIREFLERIEEKLDALTR